MLNHAVENNVLAKAPRFSLVGEVVRDRLVEPNEELIILAKAPEVLCDVYLMVSDLGIRPDDAVRVSWTEVNFVLNEIFISSGKTGAKAARYVRDVDQGKRCCSDERGKIRREIASGYSLLSRPSAPASTWRLTESAAGFSSSKKRSGYLRIWCCTRLAIALQTTSPKPPGT